MAGALNAIKIKTKQVFTMKLYQYALTATVLLATSQASHAQAFEDKFRQLNDDKFRSPNVYRTASGAPGHEYWQQEAD